MQFIDDAEFQINIDLDAGARITSLIWREMQFTVPFRGGPNNYGWFPLDTYLSNGSWQEIGPGRSLLYLPKEYRGGTIEQKIEVLDDAIRWSLEYEPGDGEIEILLSMQSWIARDLDRGGTGELEFSAAKMLQRDFDGIGHELCAPSREPWDETFSEIRGVPAIIWEDLARIDIESDAPWWAINSVDSEAIGIAPQNSPGDAPTLHPRGENYLEALFIFSPI